MPCCARRRTHPPGGDVVIVDVDERSLSSVGQWPWRRDLVGNLVGRIRELGASAIALDIVFAESDRYAGAGAATDEAMADALRPGKVVLGYALTFDNTSKPSSACVQHPLGLVLVRRGDERAPEPYFQATGVVCSLPVLDEGRRSVRISQRCPGPGWPAQARAAAGVVRRPCLSGARSRRRHRGQEHPRCQPARRQRELGHAVVRQPERAARRQEQHAAPVSGAPADVPVCVGHGRAERRDRPGTFKDKIVFVGTTALGTREVVVHADRHAVCRRGSAGDGGRQPAAAGLHPAARVRVRDRDAGRADRRHPRVAARGPVRPRVGRRHHCRVSRWSSGRARAR